MAKPVIVRSKFNKGHYHVYLPADNAGVYWTRWTLENPILTKTTCFPIGEVWYGAIRPGVSYPGGAAAPTTGSWTNDYSTSTNNWVISYSTATDGSAYKTFSLPAGYDRISIVCYAAATGGTFDILVEGVLIGTAATANANVGAKETVFSVAPSASARTITVRKTAEAKTARLIGVQVYDTSGVGVPSTAAVGIATGHDIITTHANSSDLHQFRQLPVSGQSSKVFYSNTIEMTINWGVHGSTADWTGYGQHYTDNPFVPTTAATLYVASTAVGDMSNTTTVPLGTLYEDDNITCVVEGYGDNAADAGDDFLVARITQDWSVAGCGLSVGIKWGGSADIDYQGDTPACYVPSLTLDPLMTGNVQILPSSTLTALGSDYAGLRGNKVRVIPTGRDFLIEAGSLGPVQSIFEAELSNKLYFAVDVAAMQNTDAGGGMAGSGDVWSMGGWISVRKVGQIARGRRSRLTGFSVKETDDLINY